MERLIEKLEIMEKENPRLFNIIGYSSLILSFIFGIVSVIYAITH